MVRDPNGEVRTVAINALMRLGRDAAIPAIGRSVSSMSRRLFARRRPPPSAGWTSIVWRARCSNLVGTASIPWRTALTVARANPHAKLVPFVVTCLGDPSAAVRRSAVEALARQPTVDVVGTLEPLLRDSDADVRRAVVTILGGLRSRRVRQLLRHQVESDPETLPEVVRALGKLGDTTNIPFLSALFEREGTAIKLATIDAMRDINDLATEPFLAKQLGNVDPTIRRAVVSALGASKSSNALTQLAAVARDPDPTVRSAVAEILGGLESPQAQDALTRLISRSEPRGCRYRSPSPGG